MATVDNSLDSILVQLGDFGRYQTFVFSMVCFGVILHSAIHIAFVFTAMDVNYRCEIPGCDSSTPNFDPPWIKNAIPFDNGKPEKCIKFWHRNDTSNCTLADFNLDITEECSSFIYKTEEISILQEFDLHCNDNLWKLTLVGTINNVGQFFGLFTTGLISDKYGRRALLIIGMVFAGICGLMKTWSPTYIWFLVFEFLEAAFGAGTYACGFIMGVELVGPKKRVLTGTIVSSCYAVGEVLTAGVAWLVQSWKPLVYILYTPSLLLITYFWIIPESIRWNLSKGRIEEAKDTLRKVAKYNGTTVSENALEKLGLADKDELQSKTKIPLATVFKSTPLLLRFVNCCFCWITCAFLFYGLTLNSVALAGNSYLDFILTSLVEIPAYFACTYLVDKIGRRMSLTGSFFLTGISCLVFIFLPIDSHYAVLIFYLLGKFGATAAFTVAYVITSELFPTGLRHSLMGACSAFGRIGSMVSPQTPLLSQIWTPLPLILYAAMAIIAGFLSLLFPETLNIKLPDTIEEALNIGKQTDNNDIKIS